MSLNALPILFVNLGGEMMYILEQRLTAQNIPSIKAQKVLNDIIGTMLNTRFIEELFRPQELYSKATLKTAFDKLAHASIMRLNASSMDKLYDLIQMAVKYQLFMSPTPSDLLLVTLNHVDALRAMSNLEHTHTQINLLYELLMKIYGAMSLAEFQLVRYSLLNFFQDVHIRISMFLKDQSQSPNGRFNIPALGPVPFGTEIPGAIRLFNSNGDMFKIKHFPNGGQYQPAPHMQGNTAPKGERRTKLGTNMYTTKCEPSKETQKFSPPVVNSPEDVQENQSFAKEELQFLAKLIGSGKGTSDKVEFRLNLFDFSSDDDLDISRPEHKQAILQVEAGSQYNEELTKLVENLELQKNTEEAGDLLDLMDGACK